VTKIFPPILAAVFWLDLLLHQILCCSGTDQQAQDEKEGGQVAEIKWAS
jgi:hypothetical protein